MTSHEDGRVTAEVEPVRFDVSESAVRLAASLGVVAGIVDADAARLALWLGRPDSARDLAEALLSRGEVTGDDATRAVALATLARVDAREGHLDRAIARWDDASAQLRASRRFDDEA